jgi:cell volume regulation protein A
MLGLLVSPNTIEVRHLVGGLVVGALVSFVARPVSVVVCSMPLRVPIREQAFLSLVGLRGAVPIVLATIPLAEEVRQSDDIFNVVFVLVVALTILTAPALPALAAALGVTVERTHEVEVDAAPLEGIAADMLQFKISDNSRLHGVEVGELRLSRGTSVSLIVRGDTSFTPDVRTALRRGDDVLIVTPRSDREVTERRLQAVSRGGRLGSWTGPGDGSSP